MTTKTSHRTAMITIFSVAAFILFRNLPLPAVFSREAMTVLGLMVAALLMWVTEAVNMAITTILVCVMLPFFGCMTAAEMYSSFGS